MNIFLSIAYGLVAMSAYSLSIVWSQPLVKKLGSEQVLFLRGLVICAVLAIACVPVYHQHHNKLQIMFAFCLGIVGYIPVLAYMHGLRVSRVGIVAPIGATSALVTAVLAFAVLHTSIHTIQWAAIVLVIAANISVSIDLRDLRRSKGMQLSSGIPYALVAAIGWGLFYFGLVYPTQKLGPWLSAFIVELGVTFAAGAHIVLTKQKLNLKGALSPPIIGVGLCTLIGTVAYTIGVYSYNVGIVAILSNSTALVSALLAAYFFKEKLSRSENIATGAMVVGVIMVSIN